MAQLYDPLEQKVFYAVNRYPKSKKEAEFMGLSGTRNVEMRSMTIAAFMVTQNNATIDDQLMDGNILFFLMAGSISAINHWKREGRLEEGEGGYYLTTGGLEECSKSLNGLTRGYNTSAEKVQEWVVRMLNGDEVATEKFDIENS